VKSLTAEIAEFAERKLGIGELAEAVKRVANKSLVNLPFYLISAFFAFAAV
jgi:hypothetical protein